MICHFVSFILKPFNAFSSTFQTHAASSIGSLQSDVYSLLKGCILNVIEPNVLASADNITEIEYTEKSNQVCNNVTGTGTTTRLLL